MPFVPGDMKDLNRRAVFDLIASVDEISRVDIANALGTSTPTILKITNFFLEKGFITISGEGITARGRRPQLLRFQPDNIMSVGVDYDGHRVKIAVSNYNGEVKAKKVLAADGDFDGLVKEKLHRMIMDLLSENNISRPSLLGIGLSIPGSVDTKAATVELGPLSGIRIKSNVRDTLAVLSEQTALPAHIFNDVNAAAIGEYVQRRLKFDDLVFIYYGAGIGAGIILNGKLRTGKHFYTGEIAHIVFDHEWITDINKPGWLETQLSDGALRDKFPAYAKGEHPKELIEYMAQNLALCVANICNVMDIQNVVLGGGIMYSMGDELYERSQYYANRLCMFNVELQRPLSNTPTLVGTAFMALSKELEHMLSDDVTEYSMV